MKSRVTDHETQGETAVGILVQVIAAIRVTQWYGVFLRFPQQALLTWAQANSAPAKKKVASMLAFASESDA